MSDLKTERLINLTMALLATKRLLTKDEIFSSVAGYSGAQDSMERMFERDKDDLRKLGIEIEVGPIDPFFEDELGYRIWPQKYSLNIPDFTPAEFAVLSLAGQSWRNQLLSAQSQRGLRKLESLGVEIDSDILATTVLLSDQSTSDFDLLWEAVLNKRELKFTYESEAVTERTLRPYGLTLLRGEWYVAGFDTDRNANRTFKVRRMRGITLHGRTNAFTVPEDFTIDGLFDFSFDENPFEVELRLRKGKAHAIRNHSKVTGSEGDWDLVNTLYIDLERALEEILWHGADVHCLAPQILVEKVKSIFTARTALDSHG